MPPHPARTDAGSTDVNTGAEGPLEEDEPTLDGDNEEDNPLPADDDGAEVEDETGGNALLLPVKDVEDVALDDVAPWLEPLAEAPEDAGVLVDPCADVPDDDPTTRDDDSGRDVLEPAVVLLPTPLDPLLPPAWPLDPPVVVVWHRPSRQVSNAEHSLGLLHRLRQVPLRASNPS